MFVSFLGTAHLYLQIGSRIKREGILIKWEGVDSNIINLKHLISVGKPRVLTKRDKTYSWTFFFHSARRLSASRGVRSSTSISFNSSRTGWVPPFPKKDSW